MDKSHGLNAGPGFLEVGDGFRVLQLIDLEIDQAGDDLQVVFDPVMDLGQQGFLFL